MILLGLILLGCAPTRRDISWFSFAPAQRQNLPVPLLLAPIDSSPAYMSKDMLYRMSYADNQLHPYSNSSWNASPIDLFAAVMQQTGGNNLLALDQSRQIARCALRIEITHFEQVFTGTQNSHAELDLNFTLIQLRNHRELGNSKLSFKVPAQTADARGGALALDMASHQAANRIVEWLNSSLAAIPSGTNPVRTDCER